jgi:SAM-dependent methyltransferase
VAFEVAAQAYGRFMGRFSEPLAAHFADRADVQPGQRALDVGCGPGALTAVLRDRLGADQVQAIDPSESFVAAVRARFPDVDVRRATAEELPFADDRFDRVLAQLVVHFMTDPVAGLREMGRVTRPDGQIGACVWDHAGGAGPLSTFWQAVADTDAEGPDEAGLPGTQEGQLADMCAAAGLRDIESSALTATVSFASFADWWDPYLLGVGPAGAYVRQLDEPRREVLRVRCRELLPVPPFELRAVAWCVIARP